MIFLADPRGPFNFFSAPIPRIGFQPAANTWLALLVIFPLFASGQLESSQTPLTLYPFRRAQQWVTGPPGATPMFGFLFAIPRMRRFVRLPLLSLVLDIPMSAVALQVWMEIPTLRLP